ncbi:acetoacetate--CoA ligase [Rhodopila sp.]|uniref:acetoacetate--CoA ligase n=1 Tax=Rhodopila sp. TaxID=2480087 RepID=UPI003D12D896
MDDLRNFPLRQPLYVPDPAAIACSALTGFSHYCEQHTALRFPDQAALQEFSVTDYRTFWRLFLDWSRLIVEGRPDPACENEALEQARFFPNLRLSYVENLLAQEDDAQPALTAVHDDGRPTDRLTRGDLRQAVGCATARLRALGVAAGDRVVAIIRNDAEAVVVALATAALGAIFACADPAMGATAILSRFRQLDPTLLVYVAGDDPRMRDRVAEIGRGLPTLTAAVALGDDGEHPLANLPSYKLLSTILAPVREFSRFPFNHPLFILFSSGTTGPPKCIMHGAGGTLLEHVKEHRLHGDLRRGETLFFHTSCAWMMWNWQLSALACGARIVLFDGAISGPNTLWDIVANERVNIFGTSPAYIKLCQNQGFRPDHAFPTLRAILSTGSILHDQQFDWVTDNVKHVPIQSISGGTDIIGCFVLGSPNLPVWRGEAQCRSLGLDVQAIGQPGDTYGELVCRNPFPSRPLGFYGDPDGTRFHAAYFSQNPGVWTHGDFISFTPEGTARLHGRSDDVMNIRGIRVGPAEIYAVLQDFPQIREAMTVEQRSPSEPGGSRMVLLLVLRLGDSLDPELALRIRKAIGRECSPAHVPAVIADVASLPTTHSGKRSETAARAAINGDAIRNQQALVNPDCLDTIARHPALCPPARQAARDVGHATLEEQLQAIWQAGFGFAPISMDDDFFELGGHSVLAMAIFARIRQQFGRNLPIVTLFGAPTIAALATLLRADLEDRFACLVPVLAGNGRSLFLVHGLSGTVLELSSLLQALRGGRPVSVLQAWGLQPGNAPHASVEAMASHYLAEIRAVQPSGPYALCGFSFGGLVAYEMAIRLMAEGESVELLAMVDTHVHPRHLLWPDWLAYRRRRLALLVQELVASPRHAVAAEIDGIRNAIGLRLGRGPHWQDPALALLPPLLQHVRGACEQAFTDYRPRSYRGGVTYFRALHHDPRICDPLVVWRRIADLEVVPMAGGHFDLVRPPYVAALAASLNDRLVATSCHDENAE